MSLFLIMWLSPKLYSHTNTMACFYNNNNNGGLFTNTWVGESTTIERVQIQQRLIIQLLGDKKDQGR